MATKEFKWTVLFNDINIGKNYFTKKEAKSEWNRLAKLGLFGYTIAKI
ncbi:hypothetical protein [Flagellimonas flava]